MKNMMAATSGSESLSDMKAGEEEYLKMRKKLNLDLPVFYFTLASKAESDTLYRIPKKGHRETLARFCATYGDWGKTEKYYNSLKDFKTAVYSVEPDSTNRRSLIKIKESVGDLFNRYEDGKITKAFEKIGERVERNAALDSLVSGKFQTMSAAYSSMRDEPNNMNRYIPTIHWYGTNNRYHKWITKFLVFDFGISYQDKQPIASKIGQNIFWTMLISFFSILLTYIFAVPLGVYSAVKKGTLGDSIISTILFILYSLPNFWIATLLIFFLCNPEYLQLFPTFGVGGEAVEGKNWFQALGIRIHHLILPLFCWTYGSLAFLSRQMRGGMLGVLRQDYIRTARAKGLSDRKVIWKHAFRNSLLPVITLFGNVFPLMISGSVVIEVIFSIPGMGKMLIDGMTFQDFPVVFTIVMMVAVLTMIGYLVVDILYAMVDPRISYNKK